MTTEKTTSIRQYLKTALSTEVSEGVYPTDAGTNVFDSRLYDFDDSELPAINIWTFDESQEEGMDGSSQFHRVFNCQVEIIAIVAPDGDDNPGALIDVLRNQIKSKLDRHLGGLVNCCEYQSSKMFIEDDSEKPKVIAVMTYDVLFTDY